MPIYTFICQDCNNHDDLLLKLNQNPTPCSKCGSSNLIKRLSAPHFKLTGQGWYETDFKNNNDKTPQSDSKDDTPSPNPAESGTSGDAKHESKADGKQKEGVQPKTTTDSQSKTKDNANSKASKSNTKKPTESTLKSNTTPGSQSNKTKKE